MKSKLKLTILFFFFIAFSVNAQTSFNAENYNFYLSEILNPANNFSTQLKSTSENIFVLDSMLNTSYYGGDTVYTKTTYKHNTIGEIIESIEFSKNNTGSFHPRYRHQHISDENELSLTYIFYQWNSNLQQWGYDSKDIISYNTDGKLIGEISFLYDASTEDWRNSLKNELTYIDNGKFMYDTLYAWDKTKNEWRYYMAFESILDENGNRLSVISSVHNFGDDWLILDKYEYTYENGKRVLTESYRWWSTLTQWEKWQIDERSYNEFGDEVIFLRKQWDNSDSVWVFKYKRENEFNALNQLVSETSYNWDIDSNEWIASGKTIYEYDNIGNKKIENSYDWNIDLNDWQIVINREYFYSEFTTDADIISQSQPIKLYPNPANETLIIETQNPEIPFGKLYDLNGKLMKSLTIQQGVNAFDISGLKSGVYVIQIPQKEGMLVEKLVKN